MEKKFNKNYIGTGKQVGDLDITRVSIKASEIFNCLHKFKGEWYLTFEVAKRKEKNKSGHTHTAYYRDMQEPIDNTTD